MINKYFKNKDDKIFKRISKFSFGSWININYAEKKDVEIVAKYLKHDLVDIYDSLDVYEIPRIERIDGNMVLYFRYPSRANTNLYTQTLTVILDDNFFVTISPSSNELVNSILESDSRISSNQKIKLLLAILSKISKEFSVKIKEVSDCVMKQKKDLKNISNEDIVFLIESEEILNQYLASLIPMENTIKTLLMDNFFVKYEEEKNLMTDVYVGISQLVNLCKANLKSIVSLRDSYQIIFTNNLNKNIKFLTSFTIILTIPTVLGSLYGMNIKLPFEDDPLAFWYVLIMVVILTMTFLLVSYRKKLM